MANKGGPQKAQYDKEYNARPEEKKKRAQRNAARAEVEKKRGDLPSDVDVDHKTRLKHGGTNEPSNLRVTDQTTNRGWRKGQKGAHK